MGTQYTGKTTITGNYQVDSPAAALAINIGGTTQAGTFQDQAAKYDTVSVTGTASLNGNLTVYLTNGYVPPASRTFTILTANSVVGNFRKSSGARG